MVQSLIQGWFAEHIKPAVGFIATCQGLIAVSLLLKGRIFKIGCIGAIIFLVSIIPFGVGSGFPCTLIFAVGLMILYPKGKQYVWIDDSKCAGQAALMNNISNAS